MPLNGRNFEYMSEDPYLAGQGAAAEVQGIQSNPVIATVKHYIANSQETNRTTVSSDVDQRTLHEIYAAPYEAAVREGHAGAVMCSYNRINGVYACENRDTLANVSTPRDVSLARTISEDGTVLLRNRHNVLPLTGRKQKIAVIGPGGGQQGAGRVRQRRRQQPHSRDR